MWLKDTRTFTCRDGSTRSASAKLSRNTLKHIKSVISGIFTLAKQQDYFQGENPARDTRSILGAARRKKRMPTRWRKCRRYVAASRAAATAFAVAAFMGLRHGEIQGLLWENYHDGEMHISRSIWNGRVTDPKTRKGRAPVPVIRQLAERLELHRLRCGNPQCGPIFANSPGNPLT